ncbi:glucosylceramide transporter ABCA12 [Eucyclogobius newberryi]|uniref:glucosylceramide transporter ABCA12 n=1 Tax=Eucyclogobius newberryi TaxID=166745 RepID=UPI003B5CBB18
MTLMTEITRSLNGSLFNASEMSERLERAVEQTIMAFEKTNGTLNCQEALKLWEPVREAAGLSLSSMNKWCNINIQPVIDRIFSEKSNLSSQNWNCTEMGPISTDVAAARIVWSARSFYNADVTYSQAIEQFIETFYTQLSVLVNRPLSDQAKLNLYNQLQALQIRTSLQSIELITDVLEDKFLNPYMGAIQKMLSHILTEYPTAEESPEDFFEKASMILLDTLNINDKKNNQMMMGNFSDKALVNMVIKGLQTIIDMEVFGDNPMFYRTLDQLLASNNTRTIMYKVAAMVSWFASTEEKGLDLLVQALTKIQELLSPLLSVLTDMDVDMLPNLQVLDDLSANAISFIQQLLATGGISRADPYRMSNYAMSSHNATRVRHRREASFMPVRGPMDDFIDLFSIDYPSMWQGLMVPPTTSEIVETVHVLFANPDLGIILKGATKDLAWNLESSKEETIDAALGVASLFTVPGMDFSSLDLWVHAVNMLPDGFPYVSLLKNVSRAIAEEGPENMRLMQETLQTVTMLLQTDPTDPQLLQLLNQLQKQVCDLEKTNSLKILVQGLSLEPGEFCNGIVPGMQILTEGLLFNISTLVNNIFEVFVGEPKLYNIQTNWTSVITELVGLNISSLTALNMSSAAPVVTIGEMVRNKTAFMLDLQTFGFSPGVVYLLTETNLPDNNVQILSWLVNLRRCNSTEVDDMTQKERALFEGFCSLTAEQWYSFTLLMAQQLDTEKFLYRMVLPKEIQSLVQTMLQMAATLINMMKGMLPAVQQLEEYLASIESLSFAANKEFRQMAQSQRSTLSSTASFVTISRALCRHGMLALFGVAKNPQLSVSPSTFSDNSQRQEMIERFKIPQDATLFCTNMYLDMVNTTGGAIAWAFLKPMLMGKILFTPDTAQTRAVMTKANSTLQQLADLRHYSQSWITSSDYIVKSSEMLTQTLPLLQNSLGNSFVKNFIEMQTGINVDSMRDTLNNFSNMTVMLEKNKDLLGQISTLSTLMVDISSCITFDRYQGYDSEEDLNRKAQELAKDRNLYASVIFKLPKDDTNSRKRRSASNSTTLPPKVRYTIRMHMDNVMRTDRIRQPFFSKETHISARETLRYNRGFIYLQESIDRAIIELQANKTVTDTAVQLQPFPYPCHHRDEYLEAISFVFPLLLMIAWVLFVADFVKNLVHEREMKLHEYMKMMGVNPLSHFFAWFLESAFYLVVTIFILTLVLKYGNILPKSDGFLLFLYLCDYGMSILAFSFLISTFFDKTYIAALSGSLIYVLSFFPFIIVMALETHFSFSVKSLLGLFSATAFSYASQYISRYEAQGEGIQWSNSYSSPIAGDTASFGWLCWLMLIDTFLYLIIGAYIRTVFPGKSGLPSPWYFPFTASFWTDLCSCKRSKNTGRGLFLTNIMQTQLPMFPDGDEKEKGKGNLSSKTGENFSDLPVGVTLYGLTKTYGQQAAIENINLAFYEGHVTSLLGHNGAGKTTTMSILTGLFPPSSGTVEVYGRDMQANLADVRKELGVCMQYDVLFDHMTAKEHLLLYGQIKAPHWSKRELTQQVRTILEETGMYAHRHKRVGTLSGGMKRKLSISIAFIGGSRLVVLDEPTTGVDPCSRRSIWDIVIQHKKGRTIIMSTHHLDEAEVLSDRIAFLERGGLKCCGSPFYLKDQLGQGYKLTLTKKIHNGDKKQIDNAELKAFVQVHVPEARLKEAQGSDLVYLLPPFSSDNASSYRSLLTALDSNLDALQLGGYGISDTTLEEVFLHLTHGSPDAAGDGDIPTISENVSDKDSINSYPEEEEGNYGDTICFTGSHTLSGVKLVWQQLTAILIKRFHHSRRDWKGLMSQILLPVLFVAFAMGLGTIKNDLRHYPELELSPALYNVGPSYSFFSNQNSSKLADSMLSFPGLDNACLQNSNDQLCTKSVGAWTEANGTNMFVTCKCDKEKEVCGARDYVPPHKQIPSSQIVYNLTDLNVENYLVATANDYIRNRYGGYDFGLPLPSNLQMDVKTVPKNRTLSKVWFNPEGHHTMPAYLSSMNNFILRSNLPADKDPSQYAISVSSHPYFGRPDDEDSIVQGMIQIMVALCILAGYSITTASFAIYEVNEHHNGSKRLQHIAGVSEPLYWVINFFYDMFIYMIPVTLTVGVIAAFQVPAFTERQNLAAVTVLLVLFGFSTFPWMYLLSSVFKDAEMAFITYVCINLFLSVNTIIPTSILYFMGQITQQHTEIMKVILDRLNYAFLIFPQFNFGNGLLELARTNIQVQLLSGYGIDAYKDPFSTDALGLMMISSFIQGVVFFTLRLLLNKYIVRKVRDLIRRRKEIPLVPCVNEDEDVAAEHLRVSSGAASLDVLQVNQLTKVYQHLNKKVPAVKKLSLGVPAGECFGLLGVNGAGKTTTFKMLTGDVSPTDGTAQIRDRDGRLVDIMECRNQGVNVGYCPQVDALDDLLTGEEHLYFYARLHGILKREIPRVVNYLLRRLELNHYRDTISDSYSCGTRRKLSTALALVGQPQILLLDEPSSGMDPRTKRHLWKIISDEVKGKCAVVLTSHSMEECEALCGRLAIMVKGQFQCLGSLQHIKNRFGSGFTVKMYLAKASCDAEAITRFMQSRFPSTYLKERHSAMVEYHVPVAPGGVADIFGQLESSKENLEIKHFSVRQTTLDEVFINFAMGTMEMETSSIDGEFDDDSSMKDVEA